MNNLNDRVDGLPYENRLKLLKLLLDNNVKIIENKDGSRVMWDKVDENVKKKFEELLDKLSFVPDKYKI